MKFIKNGIKTLAAVLLMAIVMFVFLLLYPLKYIANEAPVWDQIIIKDISIVDVVHDTILSPRNILIRGNRIERIYTAPPHEPTINDPNIKIIEGKGKFCIPALWDMHAHLMRRSPHIAYPAFIAHGVTHLRDMRGAYTDRDPFAAVQSSLRQWNEEVASHKLLGPQVHGYTSFAVEGPHPMFKNSPHFFNCANPEQARQLVAFFKEKKVDLIKVYNNIPRKAFFSLMQEARSAGIAVAGHKPLRVSTLEASKAGMISMEHARFFIWDSYAGSEELIKHPNPKSLDNTQMRRKFLDEHDTLKLHALFRVFRENSTWYCPTHLTRKADAFAEDATFRARYKEINPLLKIISFEDLDATLQEDTSSLGRRTYRDFYLKSLQISGLAYQHGVKILAGSDVPELPGSSLHEELQELALAGLPAYEVIRTATLHPAQYYKLENQYGSIAEGKKADLLLLSANPIEAIANTTKIDGVFAEGVYHDKESLRNINIRVYRVSHSPFMSAKLLWDMIIYMTI